MSSLADELGRLARREQIPYHVLLELTYACNLRCVMCYNPTRRTRGELTVEEYATLLDQLAEAGTMQLTLTGGEALVRPELWAIAEEARRRHFALRIFTNGTTVTPEVAGRIAELVPISVEVTLYGATPATHDAHTTATGSFHQTLQGIEHLRDAGVPVMVKVLLTRHNAAELDAMWELVERLGVSFKGFDPVVFANHNGDPAPLTLRLSAAEVAALLPDELTDHADPFTGDGEPMCGAAHDFVSITPTGDVFPCPSLRVPMGNVRERPFGEIWRSPDDATEVARIRGAMWGSLPVCGPCPSRSGCRRCPGLAHHEDGDALGASSTHCALTAARRELSQKETSSAR